MLENIQAQVSLTYLGKADLILIVNLKKISKFWKSGQLRSQQQSIKLLKWIKQLRGAGNLHLTIHHTGHIS